MKFWDASAVVPLLVEEAATAAMRRGLRTDEEMVVWWGTEVECVSAIARRRRRTDAITPDDERDAFDRLAHLSKSWKEIDPARSIREAAIRLLQTHDLRAADALQLAAAFAAAEGHPPTLVFISLDQRLNEAALREGFRLPEIEE